MSEFEKEFPSLKGMVIQDTHGLNDSVTCEDLKDCCLDKKKVEKVIDDVWPFYGITKKEFLNMIGIK